MTHNAPYATNQKSRTDVFLKSVPKQKFKIGDFVLHQGTVHQIKGVRLFQSPASLDYHIGYCFYADPFPPYYSENDIGSLDLLIGLRVRDSKSNTPTHICTVQKVKDNRLFIFCDLYRFGYWCDFNDLVFV